MVNMVFHFLIIDKESDLVLQIQTLLQERRHIIGDLQVYLNKELLVDEMKKTDLLIYL